MHVMLRLVGGMHPPPKSATAHTGTPIPIEYYTVRSEQEIDLAPAIAMNFMC